MSDINSFNFGNQSALTSGYTTNADAAKLTGTPSPNAIAAGRTDTTAKSTQVVNRQYLQPSSNPVLAVANTATFTAGLIALEQLFSPMILVNMQQAVMVAAGMSPGDTATTTSDTSGSSSSSSSASSQSSDSDANISPELKSLAAQLGVSPQQIVSSFTANAALLVKLNLPRDLSDEQMKQLMMAMEFPGSVDLSPELQVELSNITSQVNAQLNAQYGTSDVNWLSSYDNSETEQRIATSFDKNFESALAAFDGLSDADKAQLRTMHYMEETVATASQELRETFGQLTDAAALKTREDYSLNGSYTLEAGSDYYTALTNGAFLRGLEEGLSALAQQQGIGSQDLKGYLNTYLANAEDASIPEGLKASFDELAATSTASVVSSFSLPSTWSSSVSAINASGISDSQLDLVKSALNNAQERVTLATEMAETSLASTPETGVYMNYLKAITLAITEMQENIYAMQSSEASLTKKLGFGRLDTQLSSIKLQEEKAAEAREKQAEAGKFSGLIQTFAPVLDVVNKMMMAAGAIAAGPVGLAMTVLYFAKPDLFNDIFSIVQDGIDSTASAIGGPSDFQKFTKGVGLLVSLAVCTQVSGGNPMLTMSLIAQEQGPMDNFLVAIDVPQDQRMIALAVTNVVMQIVSGIALAILSGGASTELLIAQAMESVSIASKATIEITKTVAKVAFLLVQLAMMTATGVQQYSTIKYDLLQADLVVILAKMNAMQKGEVQAAIAALKELITKLQQMMNANGDNIVIGSKTLDNMLSKLGRATSEMMGPA